MSDSEWVQDEKAFAEQDKQWTVTRFLSLGFATLIVAISLIVWSSTMSGCTLAWTPLKY